ncbi:hypothetical protein [Bifidobacterium pseudolongum]|uniref:hypothetical protein n=1 Tax=Bifidobacterium pseudolongum TaxID=1694 RepID=UPI0010206B43|nr:hypothetical protein [Bifidobacterium pseudolongum]
MAINETMRSRGTFSPAPEEECASKTWHTNAYDLYGMPIPNVTQRFTSWKRGGVLQKYHVALEVESSIDGTFQAPEADCNHSMLHVHPNGHHPPSGKQMPLIKIMDLFTSEDVRVSFHVASTMLEMTVIKVLADGGEWNERAVCAGAAQGAREASSRIIRLQNASK